MRPMTRVGTCSLCGGDVMGVRGAWWLVLPPPPDTCSRCGAVAAGQSDVIPMVPAPRRRGSWRQTYTGTTTTPPPFSDCSVRLDSSLPPDVVEFRTHRTVARIENVGPSADTIPGP